VVGGRWSVERHAAERDDRSPAGYRDHEQIIEETAKVRRIWRMLMLEESRVRLFGNSVSGRRGGLSGRGRGGLIAPRSVRESIEAVVLDSPAAALGEVMPRYLNMPNIEMMSAGILAEVTACFSRAVANARFDGEKAAEQSQS
jgi:hypothetical protein